MSARSSGPDASTSAKSGSADSQRSSGSPRLRRRPAVAARRRGPSRAVSQRASDAVTRCRVPRIAQMRTRAGGRSSAARTSRSRQPWVRALTESRTAGMSCPCRPSRRLTAVTGSRSDLESSDDSARHRTISAMDRRRMRRTPSRARPRAPTYGRTISAPGTYRSGPCPASGRLTGLRGCRPAGPRS